MRMDDLNQEVDDLLEDLHKIIDEKDGAEPAEEELPDLTPYLGEDFDEEAAALKVEDMPDLTPYLGEAFEEKQPEPVAEPQPKSHWTQTQKLPRHVAELQQNQAQAYAEWQKAQNKQPEPAAPAEEQEKTAEEKNMKKRHGFRNFVLILLALALAVLALAVFVLPDQPVTDGGLGARRDGVSTILLAGTDQGGMRTDTLMLLTVDRGAGSVSLVSIPRDTLVNGSYAVPKINTVYAANNGGEEGIEMLMTRVSECIGFRPDGYMLIRLEAFVELVDQLGGVKFHVPVDMYYNDPAQDLYIDLKAGLQVLSGQQAMGVVRFRSGYTDADLGRVQVQRAFLSALIDQAVSPEGIAKSPLLLQILMEHTDTDLSARHLLWLAESLLFCDRSNIQTVTLPGSARMIGGGSYYVLDPESVAQTVNTYCNPYEKEITAADLEIRSS